MNELSPLTPVLYTPAYELKVGHPYIVFNKEGFEVYEIDNETDLETLKETLTLDQFYIIDLDKTREEMLMDIPGNTLIKVLVGMEASETQNIYQVENVLTNAAPEKNVNIAFDLVTHQLSFKINDNPPEEENINGCRIQDLAVFLRDVLTGIAKLTGNEKYTVAANKVNEAAKELGY